MCTNRLVMSEKVKGEQTMKGEFSLRMFAATCLTVSLTGVGFAAPIGLRTMVNTEELSDTLSLTVTQVPEPGILLLMGLGFLLAARRLARRIRRTP